jgi:uncharacterized membrane protein SpoIIM required for sporulation
MRTRDDFVKQREAEWQELARLLDEHALGRQTAVTISRLALLYRSLCADLMQAPGLGCGADVIDHLNALAGRAHNVLYAAQSSRRVALLRLFTLGFPQAVRESATFMLGSAGLFVLPLVVGILGAMSSPDFAHAVLPAEYLEEAREAYSHGFSGGRDLGTDGAMAGFYVYNNVGIAFRCFATGILFGLGSVFFLVYNGLVTGTVMGHIMLSGNGTNLLTFVSGHAPFELGAIIIAGGAGLCMGHAVVETRGHTRLGSLRARAPRLTALVLGTTGMLLVAAAIEAFWSPSRASNPAKWGFSALGVVSLTSYLVGAGRGASRPAGARRR